MEARGWKKGLEEGIEARRHGGTEARSGVEGRRGGVNSLFAFLPGPHFVP